MEIVCFEIHKRSVYTLNLNLTECGDERMLALKDLESRYKRD